MLKAQKYIEIVRSRGERRLPLKRVYRMIRQRDLFLAAYGGGGPKRYRIFALDDKGNRAMVCEDRKISCFNPVPLTPRKRPKTILPIAPSKDNYGTFFVSDVNIGLEDKGIKRGTVKEIRILSQLPKRCNMRGRRRSM